MSIELVNNVMCIGILMAGNIRVVELFAGVGGFRVGLEKASDKFDTVWANQWEPGRKNQFAFECYNRHFGNTESVNINDDIENVKNTVPEHDLLVGGFPCQDYSVASTNAKGIEGRKGVLWWHIRDIMENRRPKYVLLENVDRLLKSPSSQRGRDFSIILRCMSDLGYSVEWRVINAADYGCVQRRRRVFIFACRSDTPYNKMLIQSDSDAILTKYGFFCRNFPIKDVIVKSREHSSDIGPSSYKDLKELSDSFEGRFWNSGIMIGTRFYTREVAADYYGDFKFLKDIVIPGCQDEYYYQDEYLNKWDEVKSAKKILRTEKKTGYQYLYSEGRIPNPDPLDKPGRTMLTSEGTKNRSSHLIEDPLTGRKRILTPVECERMNGFPDGWTEGMSNRQRYFTMGNALVVDLIVKMGSTIMELDSIDYVENARKSWEDLMATD